MRPRPTSAGDIPVAATPRRATSTRTLLGTLAIGVSVALAIIAVGRLAHLDDVLGWPYPGINAFTPFVYLPAYAAAAVAVAYRRNLVLVLAGALVAAHLVWTLPQVLPGSPEAAPAGSSPVRVMTANLHYDNAGAGRLGAHVEAQEPDVVVLQEVSQLSLARVLSSGALDDYPHREIRQQEGAFGLAVFSRPRFPLADPDVTEAAGIPFLRVRVGTGDTRGFHLFAVHTISPTNSEFTSRWHTQFDVLTARVHTADLPVVMAGDFNATPDHRPFRRLLDAGLRDTHDVAGAGWTPTWNAEGVMPRLFRLDHVLASPAFAVTGYRVGSSFGSDHAPVTVDLALRPPVSGG